MPRQVKSKPSIGKKGRIVRLSDLCEHRSSNIRQKDLTANSGEYPIFGAGGEITRVAFAQFDEPCVGLVKDGAGVGHCMLLPAHSSIIGTMMALVPQVGTEVRFLNYLIGGLSLGSLKTGATIPHLYFKDFANRVVSLPTFAEQRRISDELDRICALKRNAEDRLELFDQLVKSQFLELFGGAKEPKSVELKAVSEITSGLTKNSKRKTFPLRYQYLRVANVFFNRLDLTEVAEIGVEEKEIEKNLLVKGDLLFVEGNGSRDQIGRVAIWDGSIESCLHQNHLIKARFGGGVIPEYALHYFMSRAGRKQILDAAVSTSGLHTLSTGKISKFKLPLPPLDQQRKFAKFVAEVEKLKANLRETAATLDQIYRAKQQEYFG